MSKFVITKTINLGFLGDRYDKSYIEVRSITMREREGIIKELANIKKEEESFDFVKRTVEERFVKGEITDGDKPAIPFTAEDLIDLPSEVYLEVLAQLQGRTDPKS